jgi:iron complex outermembrane receptor protein
VLRVVLLLLVWMTAAVQAQPTADLAGFVQDATGAPLPGVRISVRGPATRVTETGPEGRFTLQDLPEGTYDVDAALAGFAPSRRTLRLAGGRRTEVWLTLSLAHEERTVVTAARTGALDVQRTPMAVSLLPATELQRIDAQSVGSLNGLAPGLTFSQNSDYAQLTIRGIGSTVVFAGSDPSSAVYADGVYIARPVAVMADFLDLERVEVLRGPQGTLYGRNAVGGAVNVITKGPTNELATSMRVSAGTLNSLRTEARLSGPIVRNRVLASAAFLRRLREGFVRDADHPERPLGSEDATAFSSKVQVLFGRQTDLLLSGDYAHRDPTPLTYAKVLAVKPGFQIDNPPGFYDVRTSAPAENRTVQFGSSARFSTRLPAAITLTSLTAFRKLDFDNRNDADITELRLTSGHVREMQHQWSEEITVSSQRDRVTWIGGLFLFTESDRQPVSVALEASRLENRFEADVSARSAAGFGQATIGLTPRMSATVGLRHSRERKSTHSHGQVVTADRPAVPVAGTGYAFTDTISHAAWTPKFGLELHARPNVLTYASATRGFKSGGFNLTSRAAGRGYAPEFAWSYEGGMKTTVARGRATFNLAAFQSDYSDVQVQTAILPGVIDISNAAAATIRGVEVESTFRLAPPARVGGHLAWLDATYDRHIAVDAGGSAQDAAGRRLNNAPRWSGLMWLEWNLAIGRRSLVSSRVDWRWQSTVFFTPLSDRVQQQRPYGVLGLSAELKPNRRRWSVGVWARNLTNNEYLTGTFGSPPPAIGGRPGEPRQAGVQFSVWR